MSGNLLKAYISSSYDLLKEYTHRGRYFHELTSQDNSPVVVHHRTNQLTYVLSGSGKVYINGVERTITEGAALFIAAGTMHRFVADPSIKLFHIHIPDEGRENDREIVCGDDYDRYIEK